MGNPDSAMPYTGHRLGQILGYGLPICGIPVRLAENRDVVESNECSLRALSRIQDHFSIERMVAAYTECWDEVVMTEEDRA